MKNFKFALASLLLLAVTSLFATNSQAQTTRYFEYTGTGGFTISTGVKSNLTVSGNWTERTSGTSPSCSGTPKICYITVVVAAGSNNPTVAQILQLLSDNYNDGSTPHTFNTLPYSFDDNGANVHFQITAMATKS